MSDKFNNKQFFVKKLIYRSKYTGMKETDMLLGTFADKYLSKFTLNQLANKIIEELDSKSTIEYLDFRKGDVLHSLADLSTTKQLIDYDPQFSLSEGLPKTISFYKE